MFSKGVRHVLSDATLCLSEALADDHYKKKKGGGKYPRGAKRHYFI